MISLLFISLIPVSITIENKLTLFFFNGFNIIRCSDSQLQLFQSADETKRHLSKIISCDNKDDLIDNYHSGFLWQEFKIVCTSSPGRVHEEQYIDRAYLSVGGTNMLPNPKGQLTGVKGLYELKAESIDSGEHITIKSNDQPASNEFFTGDFKTRVIYLQFPGYPIICRINIIGDENKPCSSGTDQIMKNIGYVCYYNPGADTEPTAELLEAEFKEIRDRLRLDKGDYLLHFPRPVGISFNRTDSFSIRSLLVH